ncbi:MED8 [[Candida] subhashii]|uniref:Mediator of RNA polymerase II transcription subunit 8 n=1 Tax=[Candida] subhashii TaxID=561895 RepID=A0A8J5QF94_9ASCO|nr:MED8 [[Candida] subhashii]KAG7660570.1 MED8 [[Candida] subhashii]
MTSMSTPFANNTPPLIPPTDFSQIPTDSLESIRNRLNQIHLSLRKLADQINGHNRHPNKIKLPTYSHFQNQFQVLITQLSSIAAILNSNEDLLKNTNAYPTPTFPTSAQEGLLTTLLRKKALPEVDEWITSALNKSDSDDKISLAKRDELAQWCFAKVQELREEFQFYGFHTMEELDYLETPQGKLEAQEKKEVENKREEQELKITTGGKKGLHPNQVLKFMYQGQI